MPGLYTTTPSQMQGVYDNPGYPPDAGTLRVSPTRSSQITRDGSKIKVIHEHDSLTAAYEYSLAGNDIHIAITLDNLDAALPLTNIAIKLPAFQFKDDVNGNLKSWDLSYPLANPQNAFHPGTSSPLAVAYARDSTYGVAMYCPSHFDKPTLFNAAHPPKTDGFPPTVADATLFVKDIVPPGGSLKIDLTIRVTPQTDLPSLLASYIKDFETFAGPMRYDPDDRPWLSFSSFDKSHITPDNPLGYNGPDRRFDLPGGITRFERMVSPAVSVTQGTIFWEPQGYDPRGNLYRPDFDVWPESVRANLPTLINWYHQHKLKFGLLARPIDVVTPDSAGGEKLTRLNWRDPSQVAALLARFDHVISLGVNAFYFDSMGTDLDSWQTMRLIRAHLGPSIPTYSEMTNDLMLPYSGVYCQFPTGAKSNLAFTGNTLWYDAATLQIFRLLYPHSGILVTRLPGGGIHPRVKIEQLAAWHLTPMVEDSDSGAIVPYFRDLIDLHMSGGLWKN